jgi:hypothetical protein
MVNLKRKNKILLIIIYINFWENNIIFLKIFIIKSYMNILDLGGAIFLDGDLIIENSTFL